MGEGYYALIINKVKKKEKEKKRKK